MAIFIMRFLSKDHSKPNLYDNSIVTYLRQRYAKTLLKIIRLFLCLNRHKPGALKTLEITKSYILAVQIRRSIGHPVHTLVYLDKRKC